MPVDDMARLWFYDGITKLKTRVMKPVEDQKAGVRQDNPTRIGHIKRDKTKTKERATTSYIKDMPEIKPAIPDTGI